MSCWGTIIKCYKWVLHSIPGWSLTGAWDVYKNRDQKSFTTMLDIKSSAGVTPQVNLRNPLHPGKEVHKYEIPVCFETRGRRHRKSKAGVSVVTQKRTNVFQFFSKKNRSYNCITYFKWESISELNHSHAWRWFRILVHLFLKERLSARFIEPK